MGVVSLGISHPVLLPNPPRAWVMLGVTPGIPAVVPREMLVHGHCSPHLPQPWAELLREQTLSSSQQEECLEAIKGEAEPSCVAEVSRGAGGAAALAGDS